jgi:hypothetical protein
LRVEQNFSFFYAVLTSARPASLIRNISAARM